MQDEPEAPVEAVRSRYSLGRAADILVATALLAEVVVVIADVTARAALGFSLVWGQEIAQLALTVMTFVGGAVAYGRGQQLAITGIVERLPFRAREVARAFVDLFIFALSLLMMAASWPLLLSGLDERTPVLEMARTWMVLPLTIGMLLFVFEAACKLARRPAAAVIAAALMLAALLAVGVVSRPAWSALMQQPSGILAVLAVFCALLAAGIPIAFVLAASAAIFLFGSGVAGVVVVPRQMNDAVGSFILLAVPFFVFAGLLMAQGGLGRRISDFFNALIGHVRGGPLQVIIVSMYIFSGLSGSKAADMAAVGATTKDMAKARGYARAEIAAVLAASAVMGETIPPSLAMLVLGSVTTLSILTLFVAGLLPALVLAVVLMLFAYLRSRRAGIAPADRAPLRIIGRTALDAMLPMMLPVLLIGGVLTGFATPTEVSALAVVYSLLLAGLFYRELTFPQIWQAILETTTMSGMILFIVSAAAPFSWSMAIAQVPAEIAHLVSSAGGNHALFMAETIIALIVTGALLESLPALIIFAPLLLPVATEIGIDPVQYGIVLVLSMGVGAFMPPLGVGAYVACVVTGASIEELMRPLLAYLSILILAVALVALVPWFSVALPRFFGLL